jgi:hypothetical protein
VLPGHGCGGYVRSLSAALFADYQFAATPHFYWVAANGGGSDNGLIQLATRAIENFAAMQREAAD